MDIHEYLVWLRACALLSIIHCCCWRSRILTTVNLNVDWSRTPSSQPLPRVFFSPQPTKICNVVMHSIISSNSRYHAWCRKKPSLLKMSNHEFTIAQTTIYCYRSHYMLTNHNHALNYSLPYRPVQRSLPAVFWRRPAFDPVSEWTQMKQVAMLRNAAEVGAWRIMYEVTHLLGC